MAPRAELAGPGPGARSNRRGDGAEELRRTVPEPFRVLSARRETADTWTLRLQPSAGELRFAPGQFTMLYAFGAGEAPISISGDPARPGVLTHTVRAVGAVTRAICAAGRGGVLGVRGPFGSAWPSAEGRDLVVVAGGVGLAPLRSAILRALASRDRHGRVVVLYGGRSPDQLLYRPELERWRGHPDLELEVTVDAAQPGWRGRVGVVPSLIPRMGIDPAAVALVCGPEVMMRYSVDALRTCGVGTESIYISMERNMRCALGHCGHCQFGPTFICKEGAVLRYADVERFLETREI